MSDLTRRVLDAQARLASEEGTIQSDQWDDAVMELLDAAPVLARQVEAVEKAIAWEEDPIAFRIRHALRDALTDAAKETQ